jgi:hypothetical protein
MLRALLLFLVLASLGACGDDDYGIDGPGSAHDLSVADQPTLFDSGPD